MRNYIESAALAVPEIALLFLCKTATKKTLEIIDNSVFLECEIDEQMCQTFYCDCENIEDAKELEKNCVESLNY